MDEQQIKAAVLAVIERSIDPHALASAIGASPGAVVASPPPPSPPTRAEAEPARSGATKLLSRIVLGDILDDGILEARPNDRTFPLRLFFGELATLLASDEDDDGERVHLAEHAFTLASGLNFYFRAEMDGEAQLRVGVEVSRVFYQLAHTAKMDAELVAKAAPLLAALMSQSLERVKLESIDHMKVFDSQVHERTAGSDGSGARIVRPASFLCRVTANNAVKAKAQVVT